MDKYGVSLDEEHEKIAMAQGRPCPSCGGKNVNYKGSIPHCPQCGTRPWERAPDGSKKDQKDHQR